MLTKDQKIIMDANIKRENKKGIVKINRVKVVAVGVGFIELDQDLKFDITMTVKGQTIRVKRTVPRVFTFNIASVPDPFLFVTGGKYNPEYVEPTGWHDFGFDMGLVGAQVWIDGVKTVLNESKRKDRLLAHKIIDEGFRLLLEKNHIKKIRRNIMKRAVASWVGDYRYYKCYKIRRDLAKAGKIKKSSV